MAVCGDSLTVLLMTRNIQQPKAEHVNVRFLSLQRQIRSVSESQAAVSAPAAASVAHTHHVDGRHRPDAVHEDVHVYDGGFDCGEETDNSC